MKNIGFLYCLFLFSLGQSLYSMELSKTESISTNNIYSSTIIRSKHDIITTGLISSPIDLKNFQKKYNIKFISPEINYKKQLLVFSITDNLGKRVNKIYKESDKSITYYFEFRNIIIRYKLRKINPNQKHSYIQVFLVDYKNDTRKINVKILN